MTRTVLAAIASAAVFGAGGAITAVGLTGGGDGATGVTTTPAGVALPANDPHRSPGKPLAPPIILGPIHDPQAPALLYLHGGGWLITGRDALKGNRNTIRRWSNRGVAVWGADYRRDATSLLDADAAYRALRRRVGWRRRVCLLGESSGGTLALLLAAEYPSIRCVVTYATVGDLGRLGTGSLAQEVRDWLLPFGGLRRWDPLTNARHIRQPVLLIHHVADATVPVVHSRVLAQALASARLIELRSVDAEGRRTTHGQLTSSLAEHRSFATALRLVRGNNRSEPVRTDDRKLAQRRRQAVDRTRP